MWKAKVYCQFYCFTLLLGEVYRFRHRVVYCGKVKRFSHVLYCHMALRLDNEPNLKSWCNSIILMTCFKSCETSQGVLHFSVEF